MTTNFIEKEAHKNSWDQMKNLLILRQYKERSA